MNFECFPNEILLECFQYFDALQLFQSFGQLNLRFSKLIRTCPLNLSFHYVHKSIFDRFCQIMLSNSEIRSQILSLHLSNEGTAGQIKLFLSLFSFEQFPNLRSLSLTKIRSGNVSQLKSMLPLLSKLSSFHLNETDIEIDEIISVLPLSLLHTLTLRTPVATLTTQDQMRSLRYLTLCDCQMSALYHLLKYNPLLEYLAVKNISVNNDTLMNQEDEFYNLRLKRLIINEITCVFDELEDFLKHMPNVKNLMIVAISNQEFIDANRWQRFITTSLTQLRVFKFQFGWSNESFFDNIINQYKDFQSDFWINEHHWYTECIYTQTQTKIYTIPYPLKKLALSPHLIRYSNQMEKKVNVFDKVTQLVLWNYPIITDYEFYFHNIETLTVMNGATASFRYKSRQIHEFIESLDTMLNFSNLKHLRIFSRDYPDMLCILLEIFRRSPQLSSLTITLQMVLSFFDNDELCQYVNQMITKLFVGASPHSTVDDVERFCSIFSNLIELECPFENFHQVISIFSSLTKLRVLNIYQISRIDHDYLLPKLNAINESLLISYSFEYSDESKQLCFWIHRNIQ